MKTLIASIIATLIALTAHAQCPAIDSNRFAAVLTGASGAGYAEFLMDRDGGMLHYRLDRASGQILRNGSAVLSLSQPHGSMAVDGDLLEAISSNPSAFTVSAGGLSGPLNGRGSILMSGELAIETPAAGRIRTERAANATGVFSLGFVDDEPDSDDVRVDFDVMTDSVEDFDGASLVLVDGDSTTDILDLGSADGFSNGRVHGTVRLSRDELERLIAKPSGYHLHFRSPADGTFSGSLAEAVTLFVPAFGRTANGRFASDLRLYNPGSQPVNAFIQFFPAGATSALAGRAAVIRLDPRQSRVIPDAVHTLFGRTSDLGALRIVTGAQVVVDSEIGSSPATANFGQFVSGLSGCNAVTQGLLTGLSSNAALRTNIILGNPGTRAAVAHLELRDPQGRLLVSRVINLGGSEQLLVPLNGLFHDLGSDVRNAVLTMHADTPLFLGASLVQNDGSARFNVARDISKPF